MAKINRARENIVSMATPTAYISTTPSYYAVIWITAMTFLTVLSSQIKSGAVMNIMCIGIFMIAMFSWGDAIFRLDSMPTGSTYVGNVTTLVNYMATTVQPII